MVVGVTTSLDYSSYRCRPRSAGVAASLYCQQSLGRGQTPSELHPLMQKQMGLSGCDKVGVRIRIVKYMAIIIGFVNAISWAYARRCTSNWNYGGRADYGPVVAT